MLTELAEWANLAVRWLHLIAGIAWIGSSFYFMWLDARLKAPAEPKEGVAGELWAVHSGGFYQKQKFLIAPPEMPEELHWFKWEAYTTWISGMGLMALIYWAGASLYMVDPAKAALTPEQAAGLGGLVVAGGWLAYDGLCRSPLGKDVRVFGVIGFALATAVAWALTQVLADRAAFIHVGAMLGTIMVANVFFVIIPNQKKAVAAMMAGKIPDPALGKQSKQRSVHNNYMTLPVLVLMVSNHYPMLFGHPLNWLLLAGLAASGGVIRHFFNLRNAGSSQPQVLLYGALIFVTVALLASAPVPAPKAAAGPAPSFAEAEAIIAARCAGCHSARPTLAGFSAPPNGVVFDSPQDIARQSARIRARAVASHTMPLGNQTQMTDEERATLGAWIDAGAPTR